MIIQAQSKIVDMPDGVKALKIFGNEHSYGWVVGDDGPEISWNTFWVWGDDGCIYSYNTIKNRFDKLSGFLTPGTCVFNEGWDINYINKYGRWDILYDDGRETDNYQDNVDAINLELSKLGLEAEDITGIYVSLDTHIAVAGRKIIMVDDNVFSTVEKGLGKDSGDGFGQAGKVRLVDGEPGVIIADIPLSDGKTPKKPIIFRVGFSMFMISIDGGYAFFPFGQSPNFFFGNQVIFDNPVESWGEERYDEGDVTVINSLGEVRIIRERCEVRVAGEGKDAKLSESPVLATNILNCHRGDSLTFLRTKNGDVFAESCVGEKGGARVVFPTEIESIECTHNPREYNYSDKKGLYDPSFAAIFKGGNTLGFIKFNIQN